MPPGVAEKYGLDLPDYQGVDQVAEVDAGGNGGKVGSERVLKLAERQDM